jgi:hypothetical protein
MGTAEVGGKEVVWEVGEKGSMWDVSKKMDKGGCVVSTEWGRTRVWWTRVTVCMRFRGFD